MTEQQLYQEIYQEALAFATRLLSFPKGAPDLLIWNYPCELFQHPDATATANYQANRINVNRQWWEDCIKNKKRTEIEFYLFHEFRHFHQHAMIDRYRKTGETGYETAETLEKWDWEFNHYIWNDNSSPEAVDANQRQSIERDANAFGIILSNGLHAFEGLELNLRLPPWTSEDVAKYMNERPEVRRFLQEINNEYAEKAKQQVVRTTLKISPNDPCPCGSGKKFKKCRCEL